MWRADGVPRWVWLTGITLVALSWLPLVLIVRARAVPSREPRLHVVQDMDDQPSYRPQAASTLFADGRAMRLDPDGTVARGELREDDARHEGRLAGAWVTTIPVPTTETLLARGRERFTVLCAPCHGPDGRGDGTVAARAESLQEGTWVPPTPLHTAAVSALPAGQLFVTIKNGVRNMPGYASQTDSRDRWAIVAHLRTIRGGVGSGAVDRPSGPVAGQAQGAP